MGERLQYGYSTFRMIISGRMPYQIGRVLRLKTNCSRLDLSWQNLTLLLGAISILEEESKAGAQEKALYRVWRDLFIGEPLLDFSEADWEVLTLGGTRK